MQRYRTPGVYKEVVEVKPPVLRTGVPGFLGYATGKVRPLFGLASTFQDELNAAGAISARLHGQFAANGISLSDNAGLTVKDPGKRWLVADPAAPRGYLILFGTDGLSVYDDGVLAYTPYVLQHGSDFQPNFGDSVAGGYLGQAVKGFFDNGGGLCYVVRLDADEANPRTALATGLAKLAPLDDVDIVCAPDIMRTVFSNETGELQAAVVYHCNALGNRMAILDAPPGASTSGFPTPRSPNAALYFPWILVNDSASGGGTLVPPCGHVAGVYASTDANVGVHKAPANVILAGALDLEINLTDVQQGPLNDVGINCLRAFPGRGIRVWGARTLSDDAAWRYVNVRRLFLTAGRWIALNMTGSILEPNNANLWASITRDLTAYLTRLFRQGALMGASPQEAFYVKCDETTNPPEVRDRGMLVAEIGLAPSRPNEFVLVRIVQSAGGTTLTGPLPPA